jgi:hypothetical protein
MTSASSSSTIPDVLADIAYLDTIFFWKPLLSACKILEGMKTGDFYLRPPPHENVMHNSKEPRPVATAAAKFASALRHSAAGCFRMR